MPAVAVTDHGNLFAAESFYHEAKTPGVKPIIGCEVYVARAAGTTAVGATPRDAANGNANSGRNPEPGKRSTNHLVLLCENAEGYRNLIKLVSAGFLEGFYYKPRIDYDLLAKHSKGLIALSACLNGAVTQNLVEERPDQARDAAYRLRDIFGKGNFFLEIQDQGLEIEKRVNPQIAPLSRETGIPLVATNDCHYLKHTDAHAQEVLLCIQTGKTMSDTHRMKFATDQFFFKTAEEMAQVFGEIPGSARTHGGDRGALQRKHRRDAKLLSGLSGARRAHGRHAILRRSPARVSPPRASPRSARQGRILRKTLANMKRA